jgi:UPF0271 protein
MTDKTNNQTFLLNADIGEKESITELQAELALMPYLDMVNIACGGHAGNQMVMSEIMHASKEYGVLVGAHPSYPDKANFGRLSIATNKEEMAEWVQEQLGLFMKEAVKSDCNIHHIKPHGALFHDLMQKEELAGYFIETLSSLFPEKANRPYIVGLANSALEKISRQFSFPYMPEAFLDRRYLSDGSLQSRKIEGSVLNVEEAKQQFLRLMQDATVQTADGKIIKLDFKTLCVHADSPNSFEMLREIHQLRTKSSS